MRSRLALPGLLLLTAAPAQDVVQVPDARYGHDPELGLLVVAMTGQEVQEQWSGTKAGVMAGQLFTFVEPVATIVTGTGYEAVDDAGSPLAVYFTDLPLVHVTVGQEVPDEPKVPAQFSLWSAQQSLQAMPIGIEVRGGWSQTHPKKSFLIEFHQDAEMGATMDVALLGMRSDDDWNLQAMYIEPLRLRAVIGQELWMDVHPPHYQSQAPWAMSGVRHAYVELFLDGAYRGLYAVGERVDRKQLQLLPLTDAVNGELFKGVGWGGSTFTSIPPPFAPGDEYWGGFEHIYPQGLPGWPALSDFLHLVVEGTAPDLIAQIEQRFHRANAIDHLLFLNLLRAHDNTGKNIFIARFQQGDPYFYVPWDLDGSFGLGWDGALNPWTDGFLSNGLYDRWLQDMGWGGFAHGLCQRWDELRAGPFTVAAIMQRFQQAHARLAGSGVYDREELAWPGYVHQPGHLMYMENWLAERIGHLDMEYAALCAEVGVAGPDASPGIRIYPNPARAYIVVDWPAGPINAQVSMVDAMGRQVLAAVATGERTVLPVEALAPGAYQVIVHGEGGPPMHRTVVVH